jgi:hypothetical protein
MDVRERSPRATLGDLRPEARAEAGLELDLPADLLGECILDRRA